MDKPASQSAPTRKELAHEIPRILETGFFSITDHLDDRGEGRRIPDFDVLNAIEHGNIVEGPEWDEEFENWKVKLTGPTVDGDSISVVLAVDLEMECLYLITVF